MTIEFACTCDELPAHSHVYRHEQGLVDGVRVAMPIDTGDVRIWVDWRALARDLIGTAPVDLLTADQEIFDRAWTAYEHLDPWAARGDRAGQPPGKLGCDKPWRAATRHAAEIRVYAAAHRDEARRYLSRFIRGGNPAHLDGARRALHAAVESSTRAAGLDLAADGW